MTRQAMLRILLGQAKANGFEFRKWFQANIQPEWLGPSASVELLCEGSRYYSLVFSHAFAQCFWKHGTQMSFVVPAVSYTRKDPSGKIVTVTRKAFTRRTLKADAWRYHLREMVGTEDPLCYLRRFLSVKEDLANSDPAFSNAKRRVSTRAAKLN